ncbi:MAG: TyeA family type III secretion system gatekeeper subunit [Deltaproteobacteria bacterium]|nr:TyeA family type III secretion system gatekeeper subunit [Deltaproteobacteria bacterium]
MTIQSTQFTEKAPLAASLAEAGNALGAGQLMGAKVKPAANPMSLLADAAEELTFSLMEGEESRLDERKEKPAAGEERLNYFIEVARKQALEAGEKFGRPLSFLERLFKARSNADLVELMLSVKQALSGEGKAPDPADQFILLAGLKDRLGGGHPLAGLIDQALDNLAAEEPFSVASGLAADKAAPDFADIGDRDLRGTYRSMVADFASPRETLSFLRVRFGDNRLDRGLDFLMTVLGGELSSSGPSVEKSHLKALTGDLAVVRVLGLVHTGCAAVLERLDKAHGVKSRMESEQLLDAVLAARDNQFVGSRDFKNMVQKAGAPDTEREVLFLQDLLQELRNLPDLFYEGHEARQRLQDALQGALDDAVRREEVELGF